MSLIKDEQFAQNCAEKKGHKLLFYGTFEQMQESDFHNEIIPIGEFTEVTAWAGGTGSGRTEKTIIVYRDAEGLFVIEEAQVWGSWDKIVLFRIPYDGKAIAPYSPTANPRFSRSMPTYY